MGLPAARLLAGGRNAIGSLRVSMNAKLLFFDRDQVLRRVDKATHEKLYHAAARIRRIAQTSMRYVTSTRAQERQVSEGKRKSVRAYAPSRPGEPPKAVRPHPWVRKQLWFHYDRQIRTAVIGPVLLPHGSTAPNKLEFGGRIKIRNPRRRKRYVGGGGEVRIVSAAGGRDSRGRYVGYGRSVKKTTDRFGRTVLVAYARLTSDAMVRRADELNEQLYGPKTKTRPMAARPFMGPALAEEAPKLPRLWSNSVRA